MNAPIHRRQVKVVIFLHHAGGSEKIVFRQGVEKARLQFIIRLLPKRRDVAVRTRQTDANDGKR